MKKVVLPEIGDTIKWGAWTLRVLAIDGERFWTKSGEVYLTLCVTELVDGKSIQFRIIKRAPKKN